MNTNKFRLLFIVEAMVILVLIAGFFSKKDTITVELIPTNAGSFVYNEEADGWYADETLGASELVLGNIHLKPGVYRVVLSYRTDTDMENMCLAEDTSVSFDALKTNGSHLYAGLDATDYEMWLYERTEDLNIKVTFCGKGSVLVTGLSFYETSALWGMLLFGCLFLFLCIDGFWFYLAWEKKNGVSVERRNVGLMLTVTIIASSLPLMTNYVVGGGDIVFHMLRIEGIKDGLLSGQFPVRIPPEWLRGHGYASSVFYGDTILYLPGVLRLIGFDVQDSYKILLFALNVATCLVSYACFKRILANRYLGAFCSALYTMSVYRFYVLYGRAAVGEAEGNLFLPLIVYGFYRIYTEDTQKEEYKQAWIPLVIGFSGLIQSHVLSCELIGGFSALLCILLWKKTFQRNRFLMLLKAVIITVLVCLWFIVPFGDYMLSGDYTIKHVSGRTIQERGLYPAHLLFTFFGVGSQSVFTLYGMADTEPAGVGISLVAALVAFWVFYGFLPKEKRCGKYIRIGLLLSGLSVFAMICSLSVVPWDAIHGMNELFRVLISSIEFPSRFLAAATAMLTLIAGIVGLMVWQKKDRYTRLRKYLYAGSCVCLIALSGWYLNNDILYMTTQPLKLYNEESMGTGYISGEEYLPYGSEASKLTYSAPTAGAGVEIEGFEKKYLHVELYCRNTGATDSYIEVPMLYYKGYQARGEEERLCVEIGDNKVVRVNVPAGYEGNISVFFQSPWYWRVAEVISVITFIACLFVEIPRSRKLKAKRFMERGECIL